MLSQWRYFLIRWRYFFIGGILTLGFSFWWRYLSNRWHYLFVGGIWSVKYCRLEMSVTVLLLSVTVFLNFGDGIFLPLGIYWVDLFFADGISVCSLSVTVFPNLVTVFFFPWVSIQWDLFFAYGISVCLCCHFFYWSLESRSVFGFDGNLLESCFAVFSNLILQRKHGQWWVQYAAR